VKLGIEWNYRLTHRVHCCCHICPDFTKQPGVFIYCLLEDKYGSVPLSSLVVCLYLHLMVQHSLAVGVEAKPFEEAAHIFFILSTVVPSELLPMLLGVAGRSGFGVPFCLESVGISGIVGWIVPASFWAGVLVPSSDSSLASSIKSAPTLLPSFPCSFPLVGGVGGESILLLSGDGGGNVLLILGDGGGTGISWSAGGTDGEMV